MLANCSLLSWHNATEGCPKTIDLMMDTGAAAEAWSVSAHEHWMEVRIAANRSDCRILLRHVLWEITEEITLLLRLNFHNLDGYPLYCRRLKLWCLSYSYVLSVCISPTEQTPSQEALLNARVGFTEPSAERADKATTSR